MLREGRSFSGKERNCVFLNTLGSELAQSQFATISAVSGVDFPEDGRGLVQIDWDHDGDLDLWFTNRNEPRLRFLRNDFETNNQFVQFRLVGNGTDTNRNAVGAQIRVTVKSEPENGEPQTISQLREIRAGDAFISQGTLMAHFGLGENATIENVEVRWPNVNGTVETFDNVKSNARFELWQGTGKAKLLEANTSTSIVSASELKPPAPTEKQRIPLISRFSAPPVTYKTLDGKPMTLVSESNQVTLVNLWSTTCAPCLGELKEFTERHSELTEQGVRIVALCIDELDGGFFDEDSGDPIGLTRAAIERIKMPFITGMASPELVSQIQRLHNSMIEGVRPIPLPTSILIDREGKLDIIYKGTVSVEQLLADSKPLADQSAAARFARSAMLPGILLDHPSAMDIVENASAQAHIKMARALTEENRIPEAIAEYEQGLTVLQDSAFMQNDLATLLSFQGNFDRAIKLFRRSIALDANNPQYRINLAQTLISTKKIDMAGKELDQLLEKFPKHSEGHFYKGVIQGRQNQPDLAIQSLKKSIECDPENARAHFSLGTQFVQQQDWSQARKSFENALKIEPREAVVLTNLSNALLQLGETQLAEDRVRKAIEIQPSFADAQYQLGLVLLESGKKPAALNAFQEALQIQPGHAASQRAINELR